MSTTTVVGREAEAAVALRLKQQGFNLIAQNWRTRRCEIDIVAKKHKVIYFVEVKYRQTSAQGGGLDYITEKKLKQMRYCAEVWCADNSWDGDWRLLAVAVSSKGLAYQVGGLIEIN